MLLQGEIRRGAAKGDDSGCAQYGGSARWGRRGERDVMCDPRKTKPREFHPSTSRPLSPPFLQHSSLPVSANLLLPVNVTRSVARERSCTGSDEISTNLFCYRILIRFVPPCSKPRSKFRLERTRALKLQ